MGQLLFIPPLDWNIIAYTPVTHNETNARPIRDRTKGYVTLIGQDFLGYWSVERRLGCGTGVII